MNFFQIKEPTRKCWAFSLLELLCVIAVIALLSLFMFRPNARADTQVFQPNFYKTYSFTTLNTNQTLTPTFSDTIRGNTGEGVFVSVVATNATTANVTFKLDVTVDGSNYTTVPQFQWAMALNSTTPVTLYTNIDRAYLSNVRAIKLTSVANGHTNSINGFVQFSHSN